MNKTYFITGTDTSVGKTLVTCGLLHLAKQRGLSSIGLKPIASGCTLNTDGVWVNEDALMMQTAMSVELPYQQVNPIALEKAIAPHLAAREQNVTVTIRQLAGYCRGVLLERADLTLIEGAGGFRVPVNDQERLSDLVKALHLPVIVVVGLRLGCINHALLTIEAIARDGLKVVGWVSNSLSEEMPYLQENIDTLRHELNGVPHLGHVPYLSPPTLENSASFLNAGLDVLLAD